jgi:hypothetical protein
MTSFSDNTTAKYFLEFACVLVWQGAGVLIVMLKKE